MKKLSLSLIVLGVVMFGSAFLVGFGPSATYVYEGKEVFQTVQEYQTFKEVIGASEVELIEAIALSSEPPIIVQFEVQAPRYLDIPYGQRGSFPVTGLFAGSVVAGIAVTVLGCFMLAFGEAQ